MGDKKPRERVIAGEDETTGTHRYRLYKAAFTRVKEAMRAGYHLEAITLLESLLSDRMESRLSHVTQTNVGFQNLGKLIAQMRKHDAGGPFLGVLGEIDGWRELRNRALHELVKFEADDLAHVGREGRRSAPDRRARRDRASCLRRDRLRRTPQGGSAARRHRARRVPLTQTRRARDSGRGAPTARRVPLLPTRCTGSVYPTHPRCPRRDEA